MVEYIIINQTIKKTLKNRIGFSLIELTMSIGILSVAILAVSWIFVNISQKQATENFLVSLAQNRLSFQNLITADRAWTATLANANNPNMSCLQTHTSCTVSAGLPPQNFKLYDQNSNLYYDGTSPSSGFTTTGAPCGTFPTAPCVLHLNLTWHPQCDTTTNIDPTCLAPYVQIQGAYTYSGPTMTSLNWSNYNFLFGHAVERTLNSNLPCPNPYVGPACVSPKQLVCVGPFPGNWTCYYFAP